MHKITHARLQLPKLQLLTNLNSQNHEPTQIHEHELMKHMNSPKCVSVHEFQ